MTIKLVSSLLFPTASFAGAYYFYKKQKIEASCHSTTSPPPFPSNNKWDRNWDKRDPAFRLFMNKLTSTKGKSKDNKSETDQVKELQDLTPKFVRNIYLIRHGQYETEAKEDCGRVLTDLGKSQTLLTGQRLKVLNKSYDSFTVSTLTRALETATQISASLNIKINDFSQDPMLNEGYPIMPEPPSRNWRPLKVSYTDGPRIEGAFRKYMRRSEEGVDKETHEIIVGHANVFRYFCCRVLQCPEDRWLSMSMAHGSITHIRIFPDGDVVMRSFGDASFMPKDMVTR